MGIFQPGYAPSKREIVAHVIFIAGGCSYFQTKSLAAFFFLYGIFPIGSYYILYGILRPSSKYIEIREQYDKIVASNPSSSYEHNDQIAKILFKDFSSAQYRRDVVLDAFLLGTAVRFAACGILFFTSPFVGSFSRFAFTKTKSIEKLVNLWNYEKNNEERHLDFFETKIPTELRDEEELQVHQDRCVEIQNSNPETKQFPNFREPPIGLDVIGLGIFGAWFGMVGMMGVDFLYGLCF